MKFERNFTKELTSQNIINNLFINDIFTKIKIGNPLQEIPVSIKFENYPFYILSNKTRLKNNILYYEKNSSSYQNLSNEEIYPESEFFHGIFSSDNIKIENNKLEKFNFYLATEIIAPNIYEGGCIGLNIHSKQPFDFSQSNFINNLKKLKLINYFIFTLQFNNENSGELIIGDYPHSYNKTYLKKNFRFERVILNVDEPQWILEFVNITNQNFVEKKNKFSLIPEIGIIISSYNYFKYINNTFFKDLINQNICSLQLNKDFIKEQFFYIYCDENVDFQKIGKISFFQEKLNYTFELEINDLIYHFNQKKYFLIFFPYSSNSKEWILGLPFFKKYNLVFNLDKKTIGFYIPEFNSKIFLAYIIIGILIIIILGMAIYIFYLLIKKPRKKKINEFYETLIYINNN